jgi:glycosyltransferase involved in cell wall biosynthesis
MRIGVLIHDTAATYGGSHTFETSLVEAIQASTSSHKFFFHQTTPSPQVKRWRSLLKQVEVSIGGGWLVDVARKGVSRWRRLLISEEISSVEKFIQDTEIDIAWFLTPFGAPVSVPYIATVWDLQHRLQPIFPELRWDWDARERTYWAMLPSGTRIITGTQTGKNEIIQFYGVNPENVVVVPMPIADAELTMGREQPVDVREKYGVARDFLFYPAQFWPHKNHINLLLALDLLSQKEGMEFDLVLAGSDKGNLQHVTDTAAALKLTSRVHILGFLPKSEVRQFYRDAKCLVFPSFFGPDNIPPLEAFALECPVVAARVSGAEEQLGKAALFFDPRDPADMARAILMLCSNGELRAELVRRGRKLVETRTAQSYMEQMCCIFDELEPYRRTWGRQYVAL